MNSKATKPADTYASSLDTQTPHLGGNRKANSDNIIYRQRSNHDGIDRWHKDAAPYNYLMRATIAANAMP